MIIVTEEVNTPRIYSQKFKPCLIHREHNYYPLIEMISWLIRLWKVWSCVVIARWFFKVKRCSPHLSRRTDTYVYPLRTYVCFFQTVRQKDDFIPLPQSTQTVITFKRTNRRWRITYTTNIAHNSWHRILPEIYDNRKISLCGAMLSTQWLAVF